MSKACALAARTTAELSIQPATASVRGLGSADATGAAPRRSRQVVNRHRKNHRMIKRATTATKALIAVAAVTIHAMIVSCFPSFICFVWVSLVDKSTEKISESRFLPASVSASAFPACFQQELPPRAVAMGGLDCRVHLPADMLLPRQRLAVEFRLCAVDPAVNH